MPIVGYFPHSTGADRYDASFGVLDKIGFSRVDLQVDSREMMGRTADVGGKVRLALGLSSECSLTLLRLLRLGVIEFFVGVGGASPSRELERSMHSPKSLGSSPSRLSTLPRRELLELPRWNMANPFPGFPNVFGAWPDMGLKGVEGRPPKEFRLLPLFFMALPAGGGKVANGFECFLHGVSGGAIFLSASSSGLRLTFDIRPVELKAPTHSCDLLGVAIDLIGSFERVGLVALSGRDLENGWGLGRSETLGAGAKNGASSVILPPDEEVDKVFERG